MKARWVTGIVGYQSLDLKMSANGCKAKRAVAQLVERFHGMEEARGSIPLSSTMVSASPDRT